MNPIRHDQIIEDGVFTNAIASAELFEQKVIEVLSNIEKKMHSAKMTLGGSSPTSDSAQIKQMSEEIAHLTGEYKKLESQLEKLQVSKKKLIDVDKAALAGAKAAAEARIASGKSEQKTLQI
jgi:vacuolar-type H+-ATPase subunit I/STV1